MKTKLLKLFLLAIVLLTPNLVNAESTCSYAEQAELNNIVANVNATYDAVDIYNGKTFDIDAINEDGTVPEVDDYIKGFNINIMNISEDIYVVVRNNQNNDILTFYNRDTNDGEVSFQTKDASSLVTYTIEVYSNKYSCVGELFRKFTITTPIYNSYSDTAACNGKEGFYYCQEYISTEIIPIDDFVEQLEEYNAKQEENKDENKKNKGKFKEFYENNKTTIFIIGGVIIVAGVATTVILVKKKRSRVL